MVTNYEVNLSLPRKKIDSQDAERGSGKLGVSPRGDLLSFVA